MTSYFYTYNAVFDAPVSGAAKLAYAYLCKCANRTGKCFPSHKTIAAASGVCVTTVKKALAELEAAGMIAIQGQARPDCGRRTNLYTIIKNAAKGFFMTYAAVFVEKLTSKARLVYLYFCRLASGRDRAFPAHRTTAKACGLSVSGVRLAIDELEDAGVIARTAQYRDNGGQRSNLYTLVIESERGEQNCEPAMDSPATTDNAPEPAVELSVPAIEQIENTAAKPSLLQSIASLLRRVKLRITPTQLLNLPRSRLKAPGIAVIWQPPVPSGG